MLLLAGSVSNAPPPPRRPRPVAAVPVLEGRKGCHPDRHLDKVDRQKGEGTVPDEDMVIEEGPVPDEDTVSEEGPVPEEDTVTEEGTEDDEHTVREEGEHHAPVEDEDGTQVKPPPDASDKSVVDALANTAHIFCPMLRPLAGKRAQTVRSLITLIAFIMWQWHIANNVSQSALVPLLQLMG